MARRFLVYLLLILSLGVASSAPALGDTTYFVYDQYGGTWQDANKTGVNDSQMCWAAAASNVLAWGNWTTPTYNTAQAIFQDITSNFGNQPGWMYNAFNWWLGTFFPTYSATSSEMNYSGGGNLMATADSLLHKDYGVTLGIRTGSYGHAITLWGFSQNALGNYTGIYVTDSDDGTFGLMYDTIAWDGANWNLTGGLEAGWYISDLEALAAGASAVPMAPSWVLFGTGVFALYVMRRRPGKGESHSL